MPHSRMRVPRACVRSTIVERLVSMVESATPCSPSLAPSSSTRIAGSIVSAASSRRRPSAVVSPNTPWFLTIHPGCVAFSRCCSTAGNPSATDADTARLSPRTTMSRAAGDGDVGVRPEPHAALPAKAASAQIPIRGRSRWTEPRDRRCCGTSERPDSLAAPEIRHPARTWRGSLNKTRFDTRGITIALYPTAPGAICKARSIMNRNTVYDPADVRPEPFTAPASGAALLHDPARNKGTAFTETERDRLDLRGLLPPRILTLEQQLDKTLASFRGKPTDLEKYIYLISLQD